MADTGPNPKLNKDKKEPEYPTELESQFILRLPEEPAKVLRELLKTGDGIKNRLTIQIENDMRNGEVRLDHWLMHAKIIDLPTIIESLKTIDNKSFYKTADICQMMICKEEPDQTQSEEDTPSKNKKKDPYKVDKKFLWPHGLTPPTKNIRKRRFRKTLKKKFVEAPEIEKEVKRLLRADNEACELSWEVIKEDDDQHSKPQVITPTSSSKPEKKTKADRGSKKDSTKSDVSSRESSSNVVDIFGGAVSDSDAEDDTINVDLEGHMSTYENQLSDISAMMSISDVNAVKRDIFPTEFEAPLYHGKPTAYKVKKSSKRRPSSTVVSTVTRSGGLSSEEDIDYLAQDMSKDNMSLRIEQLRTELEELKQRRQRTQHEIAGMENQALRQRFQDVLHTLNQDVMYKEMEYQGLITLQNSEDI